MKTTLNKIRSHGPCGLKPNSEGERTGLCKLMHSLGKTKTDDEPLHIRTILDSNGLDDALWCLRAVAGEIRVMRLYAVWSARQVEHLMEDERSKQAISVAERHANGDATNEELTAANDAANDAASDAASDAAWAAAWAAARASALAAAWASAWASAWAAAWAAAGDAARNAQEKELRRVLDCMDAEKDPYPMKIETLRKTKWKQENH